MITQQIICDNESKINRHSESYFHFEMSVSKKRAKKSALTIRIIKSCLVSEQLPTSSGCHLIEYNFFQITPESSMEKFGPISSQLLPSNCKILLLADVDGDSMLELVTGHADRTVYVHKLETGSQEKAAVQNHLIIGIGVV